MIAKTIYECEHCGFQYMSQKEAQEHEKRHLPMIGVTNREYFFDQLDFPKRIQITFEDGSKVWYEKEDKTPSIF